MLERTGGPHSFVLDDRPAPDPGRGQFVVRVAACGVCGHDVLARRGLLGAGPGQVLGHEISGRVTSLGDGVDPGWLGRRVALVQRVPCTVCEQCRAGHTNQCRSGPGFYGEDLPGGYAEEVLASPANAAPLPDSVDDDVAAILSCAVGTGLHAMRRARVRPDDVVLVTGATGGVGIHAVQVAAASDARVIALTRSTSATSELVGAGASAVVDAADGAAAVRAAAVDLGRAGGVDVVIETTGTPTFGTSARSLAPHGRLAVVGNTDPGEAGIGVGPLIVKELEIIGSAHADRKELQDVIEMVTSGAVAPVKPRAWSLEDVGAAHAALESGELTGRAVITP